MPTMEEGRAEELQAMRDLKLLAKVRAHSGIDQLVDSLHGEQERMERLGLPDVAAAAEALIALLAPGDAGRDILRPLSEAEYEAAPAPSSEQIKDALRKGAEDMARMQRKGRRRLR